MNIQNFSNTPYHFNNIEYYSTTNEVEVHIDLIEKPSNRTWIWNFKGTHNAAASLCIDTSPGICCRVQNLDCGSSNSDLANQFPLEILQNLIVYRVDKKREGETERLTFKEKKITNLEEKPQIVPKTLEDHLFNIKVSVQDFFKQLELTKSCFLQCSH